MPQRVLINPLRTFGKSGSPRVVLINPLRAFGTARFTGLGTTDGAARSAPAQRPLSG